MSVPRQFQPTRIYNNCNGNSRGNNGRGRYNYAPGSNRSRGYKRTVGYSVGFQKNERYNQQQQQQVNQPNTNVVKRTEIIPKEEVMSRMKINDGGIYTDDEEEIPIKISENMAATRYESVSQENVQSSMQQVLTDKLNSTTLLKYFKKDIEGEEMVQITEEKIEIRISSELDNFLEDSNNNAADKELSKKFHSKSVTGIEKQEHVYYGNKETCDWEFHCGPFIFHAHQQLIQNFVENMHDLMSGVIEDWFAMQKIFEILYEHKLSDETFLKCYQEDTEMTGFWETGNRIMHLANRLGIRTVKSYMDRAVAFYRCDMFQECNNCSQRKMFASIFGLEETKSRLDNTHTASEFEFALDDFIDKTFDE